jgi:hypothetical protein
MHKKLIRFALFIAVCSLVAGAGVNPQRRASAIGCTPNSTLGVMGYSCKDGTIGSCTINGKPGTRECINGRFGPCNEKVPKPPTGPVVSGTVQPKYYILSVIYAPPGTQGGNSSSSVKYGRGSTTGTTVSSSSSFKDSGSVSVSADGGVVKGSEVSYEYSRNTKESDSLDIKKSASTEINKPGPSVDGIDHDRDEIWLWLNPTLKLTLRPTSVSWTVDNSRDAVIKPVFAGDLRNPSRMAPGVAESLRNHGITTQDFPEILKADPFATRSGPLGVLTQQRFTFLDRRRFKSLGLTFPYQPPFAPGDKPTTLTFKLENSTTESSASSVETAHTVGLKASVGFDVPLKPKLKVEGKLTWTNSTTNSTSADVKESASVTIGGPSFGYTGPTDIQVYYDVLYKTFLFVPVGSGVKPSLQGVVTRNSKRAVGGKEVVVVANGVKYRTFTNAKGEYRIFDKISGPVQVQVGGVTKRLSLLTPLQRPKADIVVP